MTTDLSTATSDELWNELRSRFNIAVLSYSKDGKVADSFNEGMWYSGTRSEVLGVLEWSRINIQERIIHDLAIGRIEETEDPPEE